MHYSLSINVADPNESLITEPELFQIVEGCEWNEFDAQLQGQIVVGGSTRQTKLERLRLRVHDALQFDYP